MLRGDGEKGGGISWRVCNMMSETSPALRVLWFHRAPWYKKSHFELPQCPPKTKAKASGTPGVENRDSEISPDLSTGYVCARAWQLDSLGHEQFSMYRE